MYARATRVDQIGRDGRESVPSLPGSSFFLVGSVLVTILGEVVQVAVTVPAWEPAYHLLIHWIDLPVVRRRVSGAAAELAIAVA